MADRVVADYPLLGARVHLLLPSSVRARVSGKLVNFQLPPADQYSVAVDSSHLPEDTIALSESVRWASWSGRTADALVTR
jgi:hypothetical protein